MPSGALSLDRDGTDVPHDVDGTHGSDSPEGIWARGLRGPECDDPWEKETKRMRELKRDQRLLDELEDLDENERSLASARLAEEQRKVAARLCLCVAMDSRSKEAMIAQIKEALAAGLTDDAGLEEAMMALQRKESLERKASAAAPSGPSHPLAIGAVAPERKMAPSRAALTPLSVGRGAPAAPPPVPPPVPPPPPPPVLAIKVKATPKQLVAIGANPKPLERKAAPERGKATSAPRPVGPTPKPLLAIGAAPPPVLPPPPPPPPPPPAKGKGKGKGVKGKGVKGQSMPVRN